MTELGESAGEKKALCNYVAMNKHLHASTTRSLSFYRAIIVHSGLFQPSCLLRSPESVLRITASHSWHGFCFSNVILSAAVRCPTIQDNTMKHMLCNRENQE
jgi:hypothetical protein